MNRPRRKYQGFNPDTDESIRVLYFGPDGKRIDKPAERESYPISSQEAQRYLEELAGM